MAKLTMEEYVKVAVAVLALPRRNRDMLVRALSQKAEAEDAKRQEAPEKGA